MLQSITWQVTDKLVRAQFAVFDETGNAARLTGAERRRILRLSDLDWMAWSDFLRDGPLPAHPVLPDMMRRLAAASHRLAVNAEHLDAAA